MKLLYNNVWWITLNKGSREYSHGLLAKTFEDLLPILSKLLEDENTGSSNNEKWEVKEIRKGPSVRIPSTKTITVEV